MIAMIVVVTAFLLAMLGPAVYRLLGRRTGLVLALHPILTLLWLLAAAGGIARGQSISVTFAWAPSLGLDFTFTVDGLGLLMGLLISGIGGLVIIYGGEYLHDHPDLPRFYTPILMFMGAMLGLVFSQNALLLFVFWELTSFSSFLLIGFDHHREAARSAAWQALLVTAGGGLALLAGFILLFVQTGSFDIQTWIASSAAIQNNPLAVWAFFLVLLGAATKSAQFPFHFWLPNAMQAPTPVSAYLHSATMVKAGLYLLARLFPVFGGLAVWQPVVLSIGLVTLLAGAFLALAQTDLKRLLAYTTVGALGTIMMLFGVGSPLALRSGLVLLLAHGLYKGSLFLASGSVDHGAGTRDVRALGGLRRIMPFTAAGAGIAALSMAGLPPLFGFISKELMYETTLSIPGWGLPVTALAVTGSAAFAAVAGWVGLLPFWEKPAGQDLHAHETPAALWAPPLLLALAGLAIGLAPVLPADWIIAPALKAVAQYPYKVKLALWHGLNPMLALSLLTILLGAGLYCARKRLQPAMHNFWERLARYGPSEGYQYALKGLIRFANNLTRLLQSGYLKIYILFMILTTLGLAFFIFLSRVGGFAVSPDSLPRFYDYVLVGVILTAAVMVTRAQSRLATIALLGSIGFSIAILFLMYSAPDLAMVQFAIETLTVILFVLVVSKLPKFARLTSRPVRALDIVVSILGGGMMTMLMLLASTHPSGSSVAAFYAENSAGLANGRNIVNVILVDFRALDTLGEISVLAIAAVGVFALLRFSRQAGQDKEE